MSQRSFQKYLDNRPVQPFESAEEVWLWCCYCESEEKGAHLSGGLTARPCETSDIAIILKRLVTEKKISQNHLRILSRFGLAQLPPHPQSGNSLEECRLWQEALNFFEPVFRLKGIIPQTA